LLPKARAAPQCETGDQKRPFEHKISRFPRLK